MVTDAGKEESYRPLNSGKIDYNLKQWQLWNSVEVHAIYELVYTMCTNKTGLTLLSTYFSSNDKKVFEPFFIAQYLLAPVNTIIKESLLPWWLKQFEHFGKENDKY